MRITPEQLAFRNKQLLMNLRYRWKKELEDYNDAELVDLYYDFAISEWYGNNDARFLDFVTEFGD